MNSILDFLEDCVAKHAVTLSEELQARNSANEESRALARTANITAILQFFERELDRRIALAERQKVFRQVRLNFSFSKKYPAIALNAMLNANTN